MCALENNVPHDIVMLFMRQKFNINGTVVPLLRDHPVVHTDGGLSRGVGGVSIII